MDNLEFGFVRDGKVFLKPFLHFDERQVGEVREDDQVSLTYFAERFAMVETKVKELETLIEDSVNKGSYLMKLIHMKEYLASFDAIGDFESLFVRLANQEQKLNEIIVTNRARNLEIKKVLMLEMEEAVLLPDWKESTEKVIDIKNRWIKTGSLEKEFQEEMEARFSSLVQDFFDRKRVYFEDRQKLMEQRLVYYTDLLASAEALNRIVDKVQAFDDLKKLQAAWKQGPEAPSKSKKEVWEKFKKQCDYVFGAYKRQVKNTTSSSPEAVIATKQELIRKVKELNDRQDASVSEEVKKLQEEWKRSGMLPKGIGEDWNDKFFIACDFVTEQVFISRLAFGKNKEYLERTPKEQLQIKIKLVKDLLARDEKDLEIFSDNYDKMRASQSGFNKMLVGKLNMQRRKVKVKKMILEKVQGDLQKLP